MQTLKTTSLKVKEHADAKEISRNCYGVLFGGKKIHTHTHTHIYIKVNVAQSCLTLWDPMDYTVDGILQARILEWAACPFSSRSSQRSNWTGVSFIAGGFFISWPTRGVVWMEGGLQFWGGLFLAEGHIYCAGASCDKCSSYTQQWRP